MENKTYTERRDEAVQRLQAIRTTRVRMEERVASLREKNTQTHDELEKALGTRDHEEAQSISKEHFERLNQRFTDLETAISDIESELRDSTEIGGIDVSTL